MDLIKLGQNSRNIMNPKEMSLKIGVVIVFSKGKKLIRVLIK